MNALLQSDRLLGILIIVFSLLLGGLVYNIEFNPKQLTLSSRFFPLLLTGLLFCLGWVLWFRPGSVDLKETRGKVCNSKGVSVAILLLIYFLIFRYIDFRIGTWLFLLLSMFVLGSRKVWELMVIPVIVSFSIYLLFRHGFTVLLPVWV